VNPSAVNVLHIDREGFLARGRLGAKSEYTRAQLDNPRMVIYAKGGLKVSHSIARIHTISNVSHYTRHRKSQDRLAGLDVWGIRGLLPPCCSMPSMISRLQ